MSKSPAQISQILLLALSVLGAGIAIYLTSVHYQNTPLICSTTGFVDCARVLSSEYSLVPGTSLPITIPGLAWCAACALLAILALRLQVQQPMLLRLELVLSLLGLLSVFYLVYVEIVRLHTLCAWCTALHVVILAIFLIVVVQMQQAAYSRS